MPRFIRKLGRGIANRFAKKIRTDDLFEQPGERQPQPALAPLREALEATTPPVVSSEQTPIVSSEQTPTALLPETGCVSMSLDEIKSLLSSPGTPRIVNHWATWCDPCVVEMPLVMKLHASLSGQVPVFGIGWDLFEGGKREDVFNRLKSYVTKQEILFPTAMVNASPEQFFSAIDMPYEKIPQTWLIASNGEVLTRIEGELTEASVAELTKQALRLVSD